MLWTRDGEPPQGVSSWDAASVERVLTPLCLYLGAVMNTGPVYAHQARGDSPDRSLGLKKLTRRGLAGRARRYLGRLATDYCTACGTIIHPTIPPPTHSFRRRAPSTRRQPAVC